MVGDPIADFLIRIKNAYSAHNMELSVPFSRIKKDIATILEKEGFITEAKVIESEQIKNKLIKITLKYKHKEPLITQVRRISKPGRRIYAKAGEIPRVRYGYGITLVSTSKGIMSNKTAATKKVGGEVICQLW